MLNYAMKQCTHTHTHIFLMPVIEIILVEEKVIRSNTCGYCRVDNIQRHILKLYI